MLHALGRVNVGFPDIVIGANAEFSFRPGNVVQAQSPNFPSQSYYGTVDPRATPRSQSVSASRLAGRAETRNRRAHLGLADDQ
jgi:hypothetical protein